MLKYIAITQFLAGVCAFGGAMIWKYQLVEDASRWFWILRESIPFFLTGAIGVLMYFSEYPKWIRWYSYAAFGWFTGEFIEQSISRIQTGLSSEENNLSIVLFLVSTIYATYLLIIAKKNDSS